MKLLNAAIIICALMLAGTQLGKGLGNMSKDKVGVELPVMTGCEVSKEDCLEMQRQAALWEKHGWRAEVHLVRNRILDVSVPIRHSHHKPELTDEETEVLARAFVRTARKLKLPLWVAVAIAQKESNFDNSAVGRDMELTLMQIRPLTPEREEAIQKGLADPAYAVSWAMGNLFAPGYRQAKKAGKSDLEAISAGLLRYNASKTYVRGVLALGAQMVKEVKLWGLVPQ